MKNKTTAALLAIFLGFFGIDLYYLGRPEDVEKAPLRILLCFIGLAFIPMIIGLVEGIKLLKQSQEEFDKKYNDGKCSDVATLQNEILAHLRGNVNVNDDDELPTF